ncbi:DUF2325 domain-containing protein [Acetivibrio clariflavus]|uniref:ABC-type uncharacterized transport system, periplasmic component n=1 Tax=Acetivibrio clariflavus (strain DSM 19732 / NBRC 101661 / EBR45) TaxID=720554 RepID=G8LWI7_ACECE|nr:DUF2325 domain-containing protein [Acetivibrio clariflavus]AEV67613.1 ABC-type uncharacterized transport system, periplasmic component [Acetivibrio clariflavus DSM 19732]
MSIVLVGGHERMHDEYKTIGSKHGCKIKVFTRLPARFEKTIGQPDAIVLFTSTVSHKMVHTAVKEAKRKNIPLIRCHTSSGNSLEETLKQISDKLIRRYKG